MEKLKKILLLLLVGLLIWISFFLWFIIDATSFSENTEEFCNNAIVLTGGRNRIRHALDIIQCIQCNGCDEGTKTNGEMKNIFISGVYGKTSLSDILRVNEDYQLIENNNVILGKNAKNTFENADEIYEWVTKNNISKVILITSDYHMRRSILVLKNKNPNLEIIPCVVKNKLHWKFLKLCAREMHKVVYVWMAIWWKKLFKVELKK